MSRNKKPTPVSNQELDKKLDIIVDKRENASRPSTNLPNRTKISLQICQIVGTFILVCCWSFQNTEIVKINSSMNNINTIKGDYINAATLAYQFGIKELVINDSNGTDFIKRAEKANALADKINFLISMSNILEGGLEIGQKIGDEIFTEEKRDAMRADIICISDIMLKC